MIEVQSKIICDRCGVERFGSITSVPENTELFEYGARLNLSCELLLWRRKLFGKEIDLCNKCYEHERLKSQEAWPLRLFTAEGP